MPRGYWKLLPICALLLACSSGRGSDTAVTVVVWTDLSVPREMDNLYVEVTGSSKTTQTATLQLSAGKAGAPISQFTVVPAGDELGFIIHVSGRIGDSVVVEQEVQSFSVPGERRAIPMLLSRSCRNLPCTRTETTCWYTACVGTSQTSQAYDPNNLPKPPGPGNDAAVATPDAPVSIDTLDPIDSRRTDVISFDAPDAGSDAIPDASLPEAIDASEDIGDTARIPDSEGMGEVSGAGGTSGAGGSGGSGGTGGTTTPLANCPSLDKPNNGDVSVSSTAPGSTANYSCGSGYALNGPVTVKCKSDGTWSDAAPSCIRDCGIPIAPTTGTIEKNGTTLGSKATYACPTGSLPASTIITCQSDGTWSGGPPTCTPVTCPDLTGTLSHGSVEVTARTYQSKAVYRCSPGYNLTAPAERTCQADGTWSGAVPACSPVDCGPLSDPTNGSVTPTPNTTFGSSANYNCKKGYAPFGGSPRDCQADGKWSGTAPTCEINCGQPTLPLHGGATSSAQGTWKNAEIEYFCYGDLQIFPSSPPPSICQEDGTWSGTLPSCLCLGSSLDWGNPCEFHCPSGATVTGVQGCSGGSSCWEAEEKCPTP